MGFDQKGSVTIRVTPAENGRWDVSENDFEDPLASFDNKEDAVDYANKLITTKEGATVQIQDDARPGSSVNQNAPRPKL
jgi:hypothetical protein